MSVPAERPVVRALIVKSHRILAEGLRRLLEESEGIEVLRVVGTAAEGLDQVARQHPDLVLAGCDLPDADIRTIVARIKEADPHVAVVMLAETSKDERECLRSLQSGYAAFVGRLQSVDQLLAVVRDANTEGAVLVPSVLAQQPRRRTPRGQGIGSALSQRELEVLHVMAAGASDRQIAADLFISLNTARKHAHNIIRKLDSHSRLEAVMTAIREGLLQ